MTESTVSLKLCHELKGIENECLTSRSLQPSKEMGVNATIRNVH